MDPKFIKIVAAMVAIWCVSCKSSPINTGTSSVKNTGVSSGASGGDYEDFLKLQMIDEIAKETPIVSLNEPELTAYDDLIFSGKYSSRVSDAAAAKKMHLLWSMAIPGWSREGMRVFNARFTSCSGFDACANKISTMSESVVFYGNIEGNGPGELFGIKNHIKTKAGIRQQSLIDILTFRVDAIKETTRLYQAAGFDGTESVGKNPYATPDETKEREESVESLIGFLKTTLLAGGRDGFIARVKTDLRAHYEESGLFSSDQKPEGAALTEGATGEKKLNEEDSITPVDDSETKTDKATTETTATSDPEKILLSDTDLEEMAYGIFLGIAETYTHLLVEKIYLERLGKRDPSTWINGLKSRVTDGSLSAKTVFLMLTQFGVWEESGAYGSLWVDVADSIHKEHLGADESQAPIISAMRLRLSERNKLVKDIVVGHKISGGDWLVRTENELEIAKKFPAFVSNRRQVDKILKAYSRVNDVAQSFKDNNKPTEKEMEKLQLAIDDLATVEFTYACYVYLNSYGINSYDLRKNPKAVTTRLKTAFDKEGFHPHDVCFSSSDGSHNAPTIKVLSKQEGREYLERITNQERVNSPERHVVAFVTRQRIKKIWAPVKLEIALTIASLPLTIISGGTAGAVAGGVAKASTRLAARYAFKTAATKAAVWFGTQALKFCTELAVFSVANRLLNNAFITGYAKITGEKSYLELRKSMFASYKHEILLGVPIFLALPRVSMLSEKLSGRLLTGMASKGKLGEALSKSPFVKDLLVTTTEVVGQNAVFLTIGELEKQTTHIMNRQKGDPLFKKFSATEFYKSLGHSSYLVLGFRGYHGLRGVRPEGNGEMLTSLKKAAQSVEMP